MSIISPNILLLSIHQKYARLIFEGDKTVELRRVRPRYLNEGDLILVYVKSPREALVGVLEVEKVVEMSPDNLWKIVEDKAGIDYKEFQEYYQKSSVGFAIFLRNYHSFDNPVKLTQLKEEWSDFRPPQCYKYLKEKEIFMLEKITNFDILSISEKHKIYQTELLDKKQEYMISKKFVTF